MHLEKTDCFVCMIMLEVIAIHAAEYVLYQAAAKHTSYVGMTGSGFVMGHRSMTLLSDFVAGVPRLTCTLSTLS